MRLSQIRMEQTYAKLGIESTRPVQEIHQPKAELNLKQEHAILEINRTPSQLTIDQKQAWIDMGIKSTLLSIAEEANYGYQAALEGIGRRAQEGDRLAAIHEGGNPIAELRANDIIGDRKQFVYGVVPSYGSVRIDFQPTILDMNWSIRGMSMNPEIKNVETNYTPGKIDIYVAQKNSLKIDFVGLFDESI